MKIPQLDHIVKNCKKLYKKISNNLISRTQKKHLERRLNVEPGKLNPTNAGLIAD